MIESLVNSELYFSHPQSFNDPFDCQIDIKKSLDHAISKVDGDEKDKLLALKVNFDKVFIDFEKSIKKFGVWASSMQLENSLMWSHYGDEHRGICLTYKFINPELFIQESQGEIIGMHPVEYNTNPITDWFIKFSRQNCNINVEDVWISVAEKYLISKDKCWCYEKEGRIISRNSGSKIIEKNTLKQVCFGLRTSQRDKDLVRDILSKHGYDVTYCQIIRDKNDFGLCVEDIK